MDADIKIIKKYGPELSGGEVTQMDEAIKREFGIENMYLKNQGDTLYFLLKQHEEIIAFGGLQKTHPVIFDNLTYTIYGFVEVIANRKGEGYGQKLITTMRDYLLSNNLTGFGFCLPKVEEFYRKCGFSIVADQTKRFIYSKGEEQITNQDGQHIFYLDSSDQFMSKVLSQHNLPVSIPNDSLW